MSIGKFIGESLEGIFELNFIGESLIQILNANR